MGWDIYFSFTSRATTVFTVLSHKSPVISEGDVNPHGIKATDKFFIALTVCACGCN